MWRSSRRLVEVTSPEGLSLRYKLQRREPGGSTEWTHFVSLPLVMEELLQPVESLQTELLQRAAISDSSVCLTPRKLHFTLFMLSLTTEERLKRACDVLQRWTHPSRDSQVPLRFDSKIGVFGNPERARVVYIAPSKEHPEVLQHLHTMADSLQSAFVQEGLLEETNDRPLTFHATLLNVKYSNRRKNNSNNRKNKPLKSMDLRPAMEHEVVLPQGKIDRVHLSALQHAPGPDGFYHCEQAITLGPQTFPM